MATKDDLIQEANIALLLCWRTYQKQKIECKFTTYSYLRVRGAIVDAYRGRYRDKNKNIKPNPATFINIDELLVHPSYYENYSDKIDFEHTIKLLEKWEQNFIELLYIQGQTLKAIGKLADVTESRACQIHSAILGKLHSAMT